VELAAAPEALSALVGMEKPLPGAVSPRAIQSTGSSASAASTPIAAYQARMRPAARRAVIPGVLSEALSEPMAQHHIVLHGPLNSARAVTSPIIGPELRPRGA